MRYSTQCRKVLGGYLFAALGISLLVTVTGYADNKPGSVAVAVKTPRPAKELATAQPRTHVLVSPVGGLKESGHRTASAVGCPLSTCDVDFCCLQHSLDDGDDQTQVACGVSGDGTTSNGYARCFDLAVEGVPGALFIDVFKFGVQQLDSDSGDIVPLEINIYLAASCPPLLASSNLIATENIDISAADEGTIILVQFDPPVEITADSFVVAEIFAPLDGTIGTPGNDHAFRPRANITPACSDALFRADDCGDIDWVGVTDIGFPDSQTVITLSGHTATGTPVVCGDSQTQACEQCDGNEDANCFRPGDCQADCTCVGRGACCSPGGKLGGCNADSTEAQCIIDGGDYLGDGTTCDECPPAACIDGVGSCFEFHGNPGCDDQECCTAVCLLNPICCAFFWDQGCVDQADVICAQPPENDDCVNPIDLFDGVLDYNTTDATTDGLPHTVCQFDDQTWHDIWYDYTATCTGNLTLSTCQEEGGDAFYDTDLVIYDTAACDTANCPPGDDLLLRCNDDAAGTCTATGTPFASRLRVPVVQGQCYKVRVGGWQEGDSGFGQLSVECEVFTVCGEFGCESGESACNCPIDCGDETCGNGVCCAAAGEDCDNCPADCGDPAANCAPGVTCESEACGTDANGGCNSDPAIYTDAACGDTFCGSAWADGATRDTDWYLVDHPGGTLVGTLTSQFPGVTFIIDGIANCGPVIVGQTGCSDGGVPITPASADLPAGQYVVFVGTGNCDGSGIFDGFPCGGGNDYTLTVDCLPPPPPSGACCLSAVGPPCEIMTQEECLAGGGDYLGDATTCFAPGDPQSFESNPNAAIPDNDATGVSDTINIGMSFAIADLDVDLAINHTWVGDLCVTLTHNATTVTLIQRPGDDLPCDPDNCCGCATDNYDIVLDDQGTGGPIETQCTDNLSSPPNYTPELALSAFNGMDSAGAWTINVTDGAGLDTGTLVTWSLHITTGQGDSNCAASLCNAACPQDVDFNGDVGPFDLANVLGCWGPVVPGTICECLDADGDGDIGPFDLAVVLGAWGVCP